MCYAQAPVSVTQMNTHTNTHEHTRTNPSPPKDNDPKIKTEALPQKGARHNSAKAYIAMQQNLRVTAHASSAAPQCCAVFVISEDGPISSFSNAPSEEVAGTAASSGKKTRQKGRKRRGTKNRKGQPPSKKAETSDTREEDEDEICRKLEEI